jgi:hypothetical protein
LPYESVKGRCAVEPMVVDQRKVGNANDFQRNEIQKLVRSTFLRCSVRFDADSKDREYFLQYFGVCR